MTTKDKTKIDFNVFNPSQPFDLVKVFNENRIVTHEYTSAGGKRLQFDNFSNTWIEDDPQIVVDNLGHVVVI
jgi:hypothetical protein